MNRLILFSIVLCGLWACSSDDDTGNSGEPGQVSGVLTAPNGSTPIPGALVYYAKSGVNAIQTGRLGNENQTAARSTGDGCPVPAGADAWACTDADGSFTLDLAGTGASGEVTIGFSKGKWSGSFTADGRGESAGTVPFSNQPSSGAPRIAVITGSYDQIENVLVKMGMSTDPEYTAGRAVQHTGRENSRRLAALSRQLHALAGGAYKSSAKIAAAGDAVECPPPPPEWPEEMDWPPEDFPCEIFPPGFDWDWFEDMEDWDWGEWEDLFGDPDWLGTETFDLYIGDRPYGEPGDYPDFSELFEPGTDGQPRLMSYDILYVNCDAAIPSGTGDWAAAVEEFVAEGGIFYVTDLSSDWVLDPFPQYVILGGSGAVTGEDVEVVDQDLLAWIQGVSCSNGACASGDGIFRLSGFGDDALEPVHDSVEPLVIKPDSGQPLTLRFPHGKGLAVFSTYHTSSGPYSPEYKAEERVLEYLFYDGNILD